MSPQRGWEVGLWNARVLGERKPWPRGAAALLGCVTRNSRDFARVRRVCSVVCPIFLGWRRQLVCFHSWKAIEPAFMPVWLQPALCYDTVKPTELARQARGLHFHWWKRCFLHWAQCVHTLKAILMYGSHEEQPKRLNSWVFLGADPQALKHGDWEKMLLEGGERQFKFKLLWMWGMNMKMGGQETCRRRWYNRLEREGKDCWRGLRRRVTRWQKSPLQTQPCCFC